MIFIKNPEVFWLFLAFPLYFLLFKLKILKGQEFCITFSDFGGEFFEFLQKKANFSSFFAKFFEVLTILSCIFAASNPVLTKDEKIYSSFSADIVFVLDCSPSMATLDFGGQSRFDAAKSAIQSAVLQNPRARFALVAFGDSASLVSPPTQDGAWLLSRLEECFVGEFGDESAAGDGLLCAAFHLKNCDADEKKIIVLIADGESNGGSANPLTAAKLAKSDGDFLVVVGVGAKGDAPIEYFDGKSGKSILGVFRSDFDENLLKSIAKEGGGTFFRAQEQEKLQNFLSETIKTESFEPKFAFQKAEFPIFEPFLAATACFFAAAVILRRFF